MSEVYSGVPKPLHCTGLDQAAATNSQLPSGNVSGFDKNFF